MCGIAGIIKPVGKLNQEEISWLAPMLKNLTHRGPDQSGDFYSEQVILGNLRLKLMDLSDAASLPMRDTEESIILSFNGEISNYLELAERFKLREKYLFQSQSDTEVLLYLYKELGIECLNHLSGMFAFILFDKSLNKVFIVRDFYGINPVFVTQINQTWVIASEIKAIKELEVTPTKLNIQALYDLFTLAYIPGDQTPFESIRELKPGTYVEIDLSLGRHQEIKYFRLSFNKKSWTEKKAVEATREALLISTERHLRSDAPIGAMCSGGIDTSSIIGMVKHLGKSSNFHTFSLSIQDLDFDESAYQKMMVDYAGTTHHQINVGLNDIIENFYTHLAFMDEPYGHGAALPTFLLAREAKRHVKGLLSGEGGDELFNAYETHGAHYWRNYYQQLPEILKKIIGSTVKNLPVSMEKLSLDFKLKRFCEGAILPIEESHLYWRHVLKDEWKEKLFKNSFQSTYRFSRELFSSNQHLDDFSRLTSWDIEYFFYGDLMVKNDRMCLAHSVESRFPYMDKIVTDLVLTIPAEYKMKGSRRRHLQKEAMKPFLPKKIYERDGFGLELPYNKWFLGPLKPMYDQYFNQDYFQNLSFLNWDIFQEIFKSHQEKRVDVGRFLWTTLILCAWYDINFIKKNTQALRLSIR
jgi:asparagine synthase (glutamine-hydrolysing)